MVDFFFSIFTVGGMFGFGDFTSVRTSLVTSSGCMLMLPYGHSSAHFPQPMHQSSIMISRFSFRRIEPTGHCVMQSGSRQERQAVATRKWS